MPGRREKDVDYLALSARVRAMENRLLTQERLDRMIDARDPAEAAKVLAECGYGELAELTGDGLEELLNQAQDQLARDLSSYPQAAAILPVFQCAADYHNAKVLVKGEALGWDGERTSCARWFWMVGPSRQPICWPREERNWPGCFEAALWPGPRSWAGHCPQPGPEA